MLLNAATPSVSVITSTYNRGNVLRHAVASVLRQTFSDFELLVIGDGCTDDSEAVVRAFGDGRVRWTNLPVNSGHQSVPNNEGLRQARGDFIAYLGHDDLWLPHHLACLSAALLEGADLAFAVVENVWPDGSVTPSPRLLNYTPGAWIPPTGVMHRRSATERCGGWRHYREITEDPDGELWRRLHESGCRFTFVPRLTAIKFSASIRRDVYSLRPDDEQVAWSARIANEPDLETRELAAMLAAAQKERPHRQNTRPYGELVKDLLHETRARLTKPKPAARRPGALVDARRKFKGLEPRP